MAVREWIWDFGKPIRFLPKSVSAYHYHSGKYCTVLCKCWAIWSVEWKTENPWTGDMTWEKMSMSWSKPLNWEFTSGSTSCLMENGHCILRREEWPWVFTNGKNWNRAWYLYLKTEGQNWGQWTIKWLEKIKWKRLRNSDRSDRVCMRNRYILYYYYSSSTITMATCDRKLRNIP